MEYLSEWSNGELLVAGAFFVFGVLILTSVYFNVKRAISGARITTRSNGRRLPIYWRADHSTTNVAEQASGAPDQIVGSPRKAPVKERYDLEPMFESIEDIDGHVGIPVEDETSERSEQSSVDIYAKQNDPAYQDVEYVDDEIVAESEWVDHESANSDSAYETLNVFNDEQAYDQSETVEEVDLPEEAANFEMSGRENDLDELYTLSQESNHEQLAGELETAETVEPSEMQDDHEETELPLVNLNQEQYAEKEITEEDETVPEPAYEEETVTQPLGQQFVVSICLMFEHEGRFYRQISGRRLQDFLRQRRFILLDNEFHLQVKSMVNEGGIRVRNYYKEPISDLVKDGTTVGFRIYFEPHRCKNPTATLDEMLRIAQSATDYFNGQVVIYDGVLTEDGRMRQLSRQRYEDIKSNLELYFPQVDPQHARHGGTTSILPRSELQQVLA